MVAYLDVAMPNKTNNINTNINTQTARSGRKLQIQEQVAVIEMILIQPQEMKIPVDYTLTFVNCKKKILMLSGIQFPFLVLRLSALMCVAIFTTISFVCTATAFSASFTPRVTTPRPRNLPMGDIAPSFWASHNFTALIF